MKQSILVFSILALLAPLFAADATGLAGNEVIIPVVGRTPGAAGSQWRTDLVVANVSMRPVSRPVTITFHPADGSLAQTLDFDLQPRASRLFPDIVATFGLEQGAGLLRVTSTDAGARLVARARVYNAGSPSGEFGQNVPGKRPADLQTRHSLPGVTGVDGSRTNIGISNPHDSELGFWFNLFDASGELRITFGFTYVAPRTVHQINDVFAWAGVAPFEGALVEISTTAPAYVWASVVRGDSGDAVFIPGVAPGPEQGDPIEPDCASPAPMLLAQNPGEGWIVILHDEVNASAAASRFIQKYEFTVYTLYEHAFKGFSSMDISAETLKELRCQAEVKVIEQNAIAVP